MCEVCGNRGHVLTKRGWERCQCLEQRWRKQLLGVFYTEKIYKESPLEKQVGENLTIEGPLATVRSHIARVLLGLNVVGKTFGVMDAYRLLEIFLEKDAEFSTTGQTTDFDLLVLLLGFGDPKNKYLPELMLQVLGRRALLGKPTWVVLGIDQAAISNRYGVDLAQKLGTFQKARVR